MESLYNFLSQASPIVLLGLALVIIFQLVNGREIIDKIRGTQKDKAPKIDETLETMQKLVSQNESLLENHFKHEIPEMVNSINRIEIKVDTLGQRVSRIEGKLEK